MTYTDALDYLQSVSTFGIKPGLERISRLLFLLNNPHENYQTIHIAGTNGKGSVSAMLESICRAAGLKTGLYTSPHLSSYLERIRIDGKNVSEDKFADAVEMIKNISIDDPPTHFEILTAAAFKIFSDEKIDVGIIETGLGGTLDSTNVITPKIAVITNIGEDHADRCIGLPGDSIIEGIARHKAGIIKKNVPVVTAATDDALKIIEEQARKMDSKIFVYKRDFQTPKCYVNLRGAYQHENSAVAFETAKIFGVDEKSIEAGLANVTWAGRYEFATYRNHRVIIDGAHNPAGVTALKTNLDEDFPAETRVFFMGILRDKNYSEMLKILLRPEDFFVATEPDSERALSSEKLADVAKKFSNHVEIGTLNRAVELANAQKNSVIIICGSLYLIGKIRDEVIR